VDLPAIAARHGAKFSSLMGAGRALQQMARDGLAECDRRLFWVTAMSGPFVRAVVAGFDTHLGRGMRRLSAPA